MIVDIAQGIGGALLLIGGLLVLRHNRAVAEEIAEWNKLEYDRRVTLYDLDRAERLKRIYEVGPLDRIGAAALGAVLVAIGGTLVAQGLT